MSASTSPCLISPAASIATAAISKPNRLRLGFGFGFELDARKYRSASASASASSSSCRAASSSSATWMMTDFDLYDLLGIDSSSSPAQIKLAYRSLQKRCHPDIAGPEGHDMSIILNDAYALLSDPASRAAYDKEQAKTSELRGYTGKPIYSVWLGSDSEQRAVFVDEVKCVGCLKCALCAERTFAIESVYGRARVVAQWADPNHKIQQAIEACPVDCISIVERSDLAALEFLMSKQPRGNVRIGASNSVGSRVSNIFVDVKKFQTRVTEARSKAATTDDEQTDLQMKARVSAIQAIRSISNWIYWQSPDMGSKALTRRTGDSRDPDLKKLRDAAASRKLAGVKSANARRTTASLSYHDEYWIPTLHALPPATATEEESAPRVSKESSSNKRQKRRDPRPSTKRNTSRNPLWRAFPVCAASVAAAIVRSQVGDGMVGDLQQHVGGSLALDIVNSSWMQVLLAGITWYFIGVTVVDLVEAALSKVGSAKEQKKM
ncbi:chaperone protein dnaJ C76, chloroplastic isoform X1 [Eucalyptus grandis]|uniref:chaperone protein dnaJ C76, chloroplastic isoform X1 n=1 Tax=Eucalyptus grandis TaxID=71139 RepID=UPI00192ED956|nr:chaperone protein dnaJ C76, chloroplastic isoform X1 [Eucalyptus grandis]